MDFGFKNYCEKNIYVVEALFANPHKYSENEKEPLRQHVITCEICQKDAEHHENWARIMEKD